MLSPYTFLCPPLYLALLYHANRPERYSRQHLEQKTVFLRFCHTIFVSWGEPVHSRWRVASLFRSIFPTGTHDGEAFVHIFPQSNRSLRRCSCPASWSCFCCSVLGSAACFAR